MVPLKKMRRQIYKSVVSFDKFLAKYKKKNWKENVDNDKNVKPIRRPIKIIIVGGRWWNMDQTFSIIIIITKDDCDSENNFFSLQQRSFENVFFLSFFLFLNNASKSIFLDYLML